MTYLTAIVDLGVLASSVMDICDHIAHLPQPDQYSVYFGRFADILESRLKAVPRTPRKEEPEDELSEDDGDLTRKERIRKTKLKLRQRKHQKEKTQRRPYRGDSPDLSDGFSKDDTDYEAED
jgi:hypothetical protein